MKKKIKIAYCLPSLYIPGGMERVLTVKANYFADVLHYEITLILTDEKEKAPYYPLSPKINIVNLGINYNELWDQPFHKKNLLYFKKQRTFKRELKKTLFSIKPDITVSMLRREINFINSIKDGSIKVGEAHINRENFRAVSQESGSNSIKKLISKYWIKQLTSKLQQLSMFVVLTEDDIPKWTGISNICAINNPLSFFPSKKSTTENKQVIAVGRFLWEKGFDRLIEAWRLVNDKHPSWILKIYGGGDKSAYQKQVDRLGIADSCLLEDAVSNISDKYIESSIFALSSRFEGFGLVLIEAMACGVPPVSFSCPTGPRYIINNNNNGILVEDGNIEELAKKICYLIEHDDIRRNMGAQARLDAEKYKIENIAKKWEELFNSLLSKRN
ncbi:glycosyltransferase family 4 protein [Bacteroides sp. 214]|uniref:glycosyltransferase family 4 protein n=1 Tax=Bacteroides sp. 214 TaxID=2302935 RepID=UPI0013D3FFFA|nr:glycosyltransferase family 4 protein [Bacteroides sp. 214]NDW12745.1 glycosyltransferase family 4 protein [Bacteroides sp. 214]